MCRTRHKLERIAMMEIQKRETGQDALNVRTPPASLSDEMLELSQAPHDEMQAGVTYLFDKLAKLQKEHPLMALKDTIHLNQCINSELLKAHAPALLAASTERSDHYAQTGQLMPVSKAEEKMIAMTIKLQEASVRLSLANVKVADEIERRQLR